MYRVNQKMISDSYPFTGWFSNISFFFIALVRTVGEMFALVPVQLLSYKLICDCANKLLLFYFLVLLCEPVSHKIW